VLFQLWTLNFCEQARTKQSQQPGRLSHQHTDWLTIENKKNYWDSADELPGSNQWAPTKISLDSDTRGERFYLREGNNDIQRECFLSC
jgi:hypothetical protein